MSGTQFAWPWQYKFPPFFTLQPNAETRRKQYDAWCQLVLDYFKSNNQYTISVPSVLDASCPLFHNREIQRKADSELVSSVLEELHRRGNLEWVDKSRKNARLIWRTPEEWAEIIAKWARSTGHGNSVCTLYELSEGEETEHEPFHGLDPALLLEALKCLQRSGKVELMGDEGVKFFCY